MAWYLVSTGPQQLSYWKANSDPTKPSVWTTELVATNVVTNCIIYDGVSPYTPPSNNSLKESDNTYNPGDTYNG